MIDPRAIGELQSLRSEVGRLKKDLEMYKKELFKAENERDQLKEASFSYMPSERTIPDGRLLQENSDLKVLIQQLTRERDEAVARTFMHQDQMRLTDSNNTWNQHQLASSSLSGSLASSINQSVYFDK